MKISKFNYIPNQHPLYLTQDDCNKLNSHEYKVIPGTFGKIIKVEQLCHIKDNSK